MKLSCSFAGLVISTLLTFNSTALAAPTEVIKECLANNSPKSGEINYSKAAVCVHDYDNALRERRHADIRQFLKENPRYRFAGQSINKCFGKPKAVLLERIEKKANGDVTIFFPKYVKTCLEDS